MCEYKICRNLTLNTITLILILPPPKPLIKDLSSNQQCNFNSPSHATYLNEIPCSLKLSLDRINTNHKLVETQDLRMRSTVQCYSFAQEPLVLERLHSAGSGLRNLLQNLQTLTILKENPTLIF